MRNVRRIHLLPVIEQVTVLREYSQGVNEMMFVLPTGAFDPRRHSDSLAAAQAELSEEVRVVSHLIFGARLGFSEAEACGDQKTARVELCAQTPAVQYTCTPEPR